MYDPKGNSKDKTVQSVQYVEAEPPSHLSSIVHRFLEIRTVDALTDDYRFHALPDACTYIVFDQLNPKITGVTKLRASSQELNLGKEFHYTNIRFLPGVWQNSVEQVQHGMVDKAYSGNLPFVEVNQSLTHQNFDEQQLTLTDFVERLVAQQLVVANPVTEKIFQNIEDIYSVADMARVSNLSTRQMQRVLKATTGFTPHDFLKVLRLQQALIGEPSLSYADQSHFIHSFRKATGYTPGKFAQKFDV